MKGLAESSPFHLLTYPHLINRFIFGHGVVIYYLFSTRASTIEEIITATPSSIRGSYFDENRPTKFIVHGFSNDGRNQWLQTMKDELLRKVILVYPKLPTQQEIVLNFDRNLSFPNTLPLFLFNNIESLDPYFADKEGFNKLRSDWAKLYFQVSSLSAHVHVLRTLVSQYLKSGALT